MDISTLCQCFIKWNNRNIMIPPHFDLLSRLGNLPFEKMTAINFGAGDYNSEIAKQIINIPFKKLVDIEIDKPTIEKISLKTFSAKQHVVVNKFIQEWGDLEKFDIAFLLDVIEHLSREEGEELLDKLERIITRKIVIFFPLEMEGFHRQNIYNNKYQEHISYWRQHDFIVRGYSVETITDCHSEYRNGVNKVYDAAWAIKAL